MRFQYFLRVCDWGPCKSFVVKTILFEAKINFRFHLSNLWDLNKKNISCPIMKNLNAMNFGCMVGLGPEILFGNVSKFLKPGDTAVLCWEYETYRFDRRSPKSKISYILVNRLMANFQFRGHPTIF